MFGSILVLSSALLHGYVFWRASTVPLVRRLVPPRITVLAGAAAFCALAASRFQGHGGSGPAAAALERYGLDWLSALFIASSCLLAVDIPTLFGRLLPRWAPSLRGIALAAAAAISVFASWQGTKAPAVEEFRVSLPGLPPDLDGTVVTAMADMHLGEQLGPLWLSERVEQVRRTRPDLVLLLGDIFEGHGTPSRELTEGLRALSAPMGVFAVPGNHESHGGGEAGIAALERAGLRVLRGKWEQPRPGLLLAGVDDLTALRRSGKDDHVGEEVAKALAGRPPGGTIFLSHTPWGAKEAAGAGAGLMLSGHTHGGQVWPFGYLTSLVYPLLDGEYDVGGMKVIVSRGTGTWGARMRLWHPSQIVRVTLLSPVRRPPSSSPAPS